MEKIWEGMDVDVIDTYEQMLYQRAINGIRPMLYVSSNTDFECSRMMLLDEFSEDILSGRQRPVSRGSWYSVVTN